VIGLPRSARILLFSEPADMRKGPNGLQGLVLAAGEDPFGGDLFLFISRRRDRAKILTYDGGGLVLWYKRLELGRFRHPKRDESNIELDATALAMLLDGIDVERVRRPAKWDPRKPRKETIDKQARL
jgi:transposase